MTIEFFCRGRSCLRPPFTKMYMIMRLTAAMLLLLFFQAGATGFSQKVNLERKHATLEQIFLQIEKQTGYTFWYENKLLDGLGKMDVAITNAPLKQAMETVLANKPLTFAIIEKTIIIRKKAPVTLPSSLQLEAEPSVIINGKVLDSQSGLPVAGASVVVKGTKKGVTTDVNGNFAIEVNTGQTLVISFVGYEDQEVKVKDAGAITVKLAITSASMKDMVVMGVMNRPKQNFTGAASSFSQEELKRASANNVLNALRSLDPAFQMPDNLVNGSNPNAQQNIVLRGGNSLADLSTSNTSDVFNYTRSPNVPLFILDGFEVSLQRINDLDMNRISNVTILKDASATAIYGSRAANGVVVIETIRPKEGKLRVSYTGSVISEIPDLKGYDLLNAREKLELEKDGGVYNFPTIPYIQEQRDVMYSYRRALVEKGNNTDWKRVPVRNGLGHTHNLYIEGGSDAVLYGINGTYNNFAGAMKGSSRENISGNTFLSYRYKNFLFRNDLTINYTKATNSPYGSYQTYVSLNPYWSPYNKDGQINYYLEDIRHINGDTLSQETNPLYNLSLHTVDQSTIQNITNNLFVQWQAKRWLRLSGRLAYVKTSNESDRFLPARHTSFNSIPLDRYYERGSYTKAYGKNNVIDASFTIDANKSFGNHLLFGSLGTTARQEKMGTEIYTLIGFPNENLDNVLVGSYPQDGRRPTGFEGFSRLLGYFANISYSYDSRYLFDVSYRLDGSSQFGSDKRFAPFWSVGGGWNVHKENFLRNNDQINQLKLRYSYGYTGSSNFSSYLGLTTSQYYTAQDYLYNIGTSLLGFGNSSLRWQQTLKQNFGADLTLFKNLQATVDVFNERTKGSVISVTTAPSTGFSMYMDNMGDVVSKGYELRLNYTIFTNPSNRDSWSVFASGMHVTSKVERISNTLEALNKKNADSLSATPLPRYAEGRSTTAIWAVPSLGIDPSTGREIYLTRNGQKTNNYDPLDQIIVGDARADLLGTFGTNLEIRGIGLNLFFEYRLGGQAYNQTLINKVENADIRRNVDRRVYEDRWREPGDQTFFKGIVSVEGYTVTGNTYNTSRFVQNDNWLSLRNASVYYRFPKSLNNRFGLKDTKISLFSSQLFWLSTIRQERGLDYPFSRSFTFQLQTTF